MTKRDNDELKARQEGTLEEDCCRLVDGICEMGYQSCALTMFHPNCRDRKTIQPDKRLSQQGEIREGMWGVLMDNRMDVVLGYYETPISKLLAYLHSQGVVLKADRELPPNCQYCEFHHCHYDSEGIQDCSCGLSCFANTCSSGVPESCPLKLVCAFEPLIGGK